MIWERFRYRHGIAAASDHPLYEHAKDIQDVVGALVESVARLTRREGVDMKFCAEEEWHLNGEKTLGLWLDVRDCPKTEKHS